MKHQPGLLCAPLLLAGRWPLAAQTSENSLIAISPCPGDCELYRGTYILERFSPPDAVALIAFCAGSL